MMNSNVILFCSIFILSENFQKSLLISTSEIRYNIFYKNTKFLHIVMNQLFSILKLNKRFKETAKAELLLNMHSSIVKIIQEKHKLAKSHNITNKISTKDFVNITEKIDEILESNTILYSNSSDFYSILHNIISEETIERDFMINLRNFLFKKTEHLKLVTAVSNEAENNSQINQLRRNLSRNMVQNFKAWVPEAELSRRIYKSKKTNIKKYPFIVSVHLFSEFVCAGSIINRDMVITSASCLQGTFTKRHKSIPTNVVVRVGSDYTTYGGELIPVVEIFIHPAYDSNTLRNNLAILRMDITKFFNMKEIRIRRVLYEKIRIQEARTVMMLGWGARNKANEPFEFQKISLAHLDVVTLEECKEVYSRLYVTEHNFCAGFVAKGSGACMKDVGDPAIVEDVLVGIVSYGPPLCGTPDAPTVFTKISDHTYWIDSIIKLSSIKSRKKQVLRMPMPSTLAYIPKIPHEIAHPQIKYNYDYPEEILILREILRDLQESKKSLIDDIIDEGFNKEILNGIESTTKIDIFHHPLANKSIYLISKMPSPNTNTEIHTVSLTTSTNTATTLPVPEFIPIPDYVENYEEFVNMFDYLYTFTYTSRSRPNRSRPPPSTKSTKHFTDFAGSIWTFANQLSIDDSIITSENYEDSSGLSVEVTKEKTHEESTRL